MSFAAQHRILFQESPTALVLLGANGTVREVNRAAVRELQHGRVRLLGTPFPKLVAPGDRRRSREILSHVLEGGKRCWAIRLRRGDGLYRHFTVTARSVERAESVRGALLFMEARDGPDDPALEQIADLLGSLPGHYVLVVDTEGVIRTARGVSRTLFVDEDHCVGRAFSSLLDSSGLAERLWESMRQATASGETWSAVASHRRADGAQIEMHLFARPFLEPLTGRRLGAVVAGRDITETRTLRRELARTDRLAEIGAVTTELVRRIRSEVEAPKSGSDPEEGRGSDGRATPRILDLIEPLEAYAAGLESEARVVPTCLADAVDTVLERRREEIRGRGIEVEVVRDTDAAEVFAVPGLLVRVVDTLLENALESLEEAREPHLRLVVQEGGEHGHLRIEDTGPPVPRELGGKIYEPFFTTKEQHLGLGLTLARSTISGWDGEIDHRTLTDGRTSFSLILRSDLPDAPSAFPTSPLDLSGQRSILIVDDEEDVRLALRRFLEKVGYEVQEAWSGRSAVAHLTSGDPPDLVLTDLNMEEGTGQWLLGELEKDFPSLLKRTAILTGNARPREIERLRSTHGCPLIEKPFEPGELLDLLDRLAGRG